MEEGGIKIFAAETPNMAPGSGKRVAFHFALANPKQESPNSYLQILGGFRRGKPF